MLLIPTYLARSAIHGYGVFAASRIREGTRIWELVPEVDMVLDPKVLADCPEALSSNLADHLYLDGAGQYILCGDNARFMNHADHPNCFDDGLRHTIAVREIFPGDELTCDYRLFDRRLRGDRPLTF